MSDDLTIREIAEKVMQIRSILAGLHPHLQGVLLAELLATWLAGHIASPREKTDEMREAMLKAHIESVVQLIPVNEYILLAVREEDPNEPAMRVVTFDEDGMHELGQQSMSQIHDIIGKATGDKS